MAECFLRRRRVYSSLLPYPEGLTHYFDLTAFSLGQTVIDNALSAPGSLNINSGTELDGGVGFTGAAKRSYGVTDTLADSEEAVIVYTVCELYNVSAPNFIINLSSDSSNTSLGVGRLETGGTQIPSLYPGAYNAGTQQTLNCNFYREFIPMAIVVNGTDAAGYGFNILSLRCHKVTFSNVPIHNGKIYLGTEKSLTSNCTTAFRMLAVGNEIPEDAKIQKNLEYLYYKYCV